MPNQNGLQNKPPAAPDARVDGPNSGPNAVRVQSYCGVQLHSYVKETRDKLKFKDKDGNEITPNESVAVKKMIQYCYFHNADFLNFWNK